MNKKVMISIIIILLAIVIGLTIWQFILINNSILESNKEDEENEIINNVEISAEYVTDDCINEWSDYASVIQEESILANSSLVDENTHYLVKDVDGYIYVYYLNDDNEEVLYRETSISTQYLSAFDLDDLEIGIEVVGLEELNKLLEDFE